MPTNLVALKPFPYDNISLKVGDRFEASDVHAHLLKLVKLADDAPIERPRWLQTRVLEAEPDVYVGVGLSSAKDTTVAAPVARVKRRYRRRDLRAEP